MWYTTQFKCVQKRIPKKYEGKIFQRSKVISNRCSVYCMTPMWVFEPLCWHRNSANKTKQDKTEVSIITVCPGATTVFCTFHRNNVCTYRALNVRMLDRDQVQWYTLHFILSRKGGRHIRKRLGRVPKEVEGTLNMKDRSYARVDSTSNSRSLYRNISSSKKILAVLKWLIIQSF